MPPNSDIGALINIEAAISKLLNKYKVLSHVYGGFITPTKSGGIRLLRSISIVQDASIKTPPPIHIPCIIIPRNINTAVITIETLDAVINNLTQKIRYLVIVNKHGIFALSTSPNISTTKLRAIFKNKAFIEKFYKYNHDYKKLRQVLKTKGFILDKLD